MRRLTTHLIFAVLLVLAATPAVADTTISYQGQLQEGGGPVDASVDMTFELFDAASGGASVGGPLIENGVTVTNGLSQVALDFGEQPYSNGLWLAIEVEGDLLAPRQLIIGAPFAISAAPGSGSNWEVSGADIHYVDGKVGIGTSLPSAALDVIGSAKFGYSSNQVSGVNSFVTGGANGIRNRAEGNHSFVGGGLDSFAGGDTSFVGGGRQNTASGSRSFVGGGIGNSATGVHSFVSGGLTNTAAGESSFVGGGSSNTASGRNSFAAGCYAEAQHNGTFVWADRPCINFSSTGENQFLIRAGGGVGIGTAAPNSQLHVNAATGEDPLRAQINGQTAFSVSSNAGVAIGGFTVLTPDNGLYVAGRTSLGTAIPGRDLHVKQSGTDNGQIGLQIERSDSSNNWAFYIATSDNLGFRYNDNLVARIDTSGQFATLSDARHKTDIGPIESPLTRLLALEPAQYRMKAGTSDSEPSFGLIAQQVRDVVPSAVSESEDTLGIRYNQITALNTAAIIELHTLLRSMRETLQESRNRNDILAAENDALRHRLSERNDRVQRRLLALETAINGDKRMSDSGSSQARME